MTITKLDDNALVIMYNVPVNQNSDYYQPTTQIIAGTVSKVVKCDYAVDIFIRLFP